jgi:putative endonuclease
VQDISTKSPASHPPKPASAAGAARQRRAALAKARGRAAEDTALAYLSQQGLRLLARNVNYRVGELDLVMADQNCIVFVEVRWRSPSQFQSAAGSVGYRKQQRLVRAAQLWLMQNMSQLPACRFDVVACGPGQLDWIRNAFS